MEVQLNQAGAGAAPAVGVGGVAALLATLFKLRIGVAIMLSGLAGALVAAGRWPSLADLAVLGLAILMSASGAGACNHYHERDIDALMRRTRDRPFATGSLAPSLRWPLCFAAMILAGGALAGLWFDWLTGALVVAGALTYAVVYTVWLKRRTHWNIVVGGLAGSFAVLAGGASQGGMSSPALLALAVMLFLWTPSHFWSLAIAMADDYRRAGVPMLPVTLGPRAAARWNLANTVVLAASGVAFAALIAHPVVWAAVLAGCGYLLHATARMARDPVPAVSMAAFRASLLQLGLLLVAIFVATPGA